MSGESEFARLLRWYPASWRRDHGDVVLGTMLDVADADGRDAPTRAERRAAFVDGLGHRLDRRIAIGAAVAAVGVAMLVWTVQLALAAGWPQAVAVLSGAVPLFAVVSLVATARVRGMRPGAALLGGLIGVAAATALALTMLSWSIGFDEADAGAVRSPLGAAFLVLLCVAWTLGAAATTILLGELLRKRLRDVGAYAAALAIGVVCWPVLAYSLLSVASAVLLALGMLTAAAVATRPRAVLDAPAAPAASAPAAPFSVSRRRRGLIAVLAGLSLAAGAAAGVFAFAGPLWTTLDATEAMRVGIGAGAVGAIPLALCLGFRRARGVHRWGPPLLAALGLVVLAVGNVFGSGDGSTLPLLVAAAPVAGGVAWLVATLPRLLAARVVLAIVVAVATLVLSPMLQILPFVSPVVATGLLLSSILTTPRRRAADGVAAET